MRRRVIEGMTSLSRGESSSRFQRSVRARELSDHRDIRNLRRLAVRSATKPLHTCTEAGALRDKFLRDKFSRDEFAMARAYPSSALGAVLDHFGIDPCFDGKDLIGG